MRGFLVKRTTGSPWKMLGLVGTLGVEMLASLLGAAWLGKWLDERWGTEPVLLLIGIMGGLVLGYISVFITIKVYLKE